VTRARPSAAGETAQAFQGPRLVLALAPCPTGWDFDPARRVEVGRLAVRAVRSGVWPLEAYVDGRGAKEQP
jgi:pyruvate ferredoxin oxidoreductase beta subunit